MLVGDCKKQFARHDKYVRVMTLTVYFRATDFVDIFKKHDSGSYDANMHFFTI